jgi:hypothetical protein
LQKRFFFWQTAKKDRNAPEKHGKLQCVCKQNGAKEKEFVNNTGN